jgi:hypothetical protein
MRMTAGRWGCFDLTLNKAKMPNTLLNITAACATLFCCTLSFYSILCSVYAVAICLVFIVIIVVVASAKYNVISSSQRSTVSNCRKGGKSHALQCPLNTVVALLWTRVEQHLAGISAKAISSYAENSLGVSIQMETFSLGPVRPCVVGVASSCATESRNYWLDINFAYKGGNEIIVRWAHRGMTLRFGVHDISIRGCARIERRHDSKDICVSLTGDPQIGFDFTHTTDVLDYLPFLNFYIRLKIGQAIAQAVVLPNYIAL